MIIEREAATRFGAVVLLVAIAYLHLLDISHKVDEGVWYMAFLFAALIVGSFVIAVGLVRSSPHAVRHHWVAAGLLALGALGGYFMSRMLPLPQMADHQGDWISMVGVLAGFAELALVAVAAFAMRDLTVRGIPNGSMVRFRVPRLAIAPSTILLMLTLPVQAFAHGGKDDEAESAPAPAGPEGLGDPAVSAKAPAASGHGDPFLGSGELWTAALLCAGFIAWAGHSLRARTVQEPAFD